MSFRQTNIKYGLINVNAIENERTKARWVLEVFHLYREHLEQDVQIKNFRTQI